MFADREGCLASVECVYHDDAKPDWPALDDCAVMLHDEMRYLTAVVLPGGSVARPQEDNDRWVGTHFSGAGFTGTTWSGYRERFDAAGNLTERIFVK